MGLSMNWCQEWIVYFSSSISFHFHAENKAIHLEERKDNKRGGV